MINFKVITVKNLIEKSEIGMKKILSMLAIFAIVSSQGICDDNEVYDDGFYASKEPIESPPIHVCDVPSYSYRMRCEEKLVPVRKMACRPVQRSYEVQRVKYVPQVYTETITRTEMEYYYVDSVDVRQNWVCDRNCEFTSVYSRPTPCPDENSMTPCENKCPKHYPRPFGCKECP